MDLAELTANTEFEMNKNELIQDVAKRSGMSPDEAQRAVNAVVASISQALAMRKVVSVRGLGIFSVERQLSVSFQVFSSPDEERPSSTRVVFQAADELIDEEGSDDPGPSMVSK